MSDSPSTPQSTPTGGKELPPGTRLEEFVIERVLGSGGFGITYLARDASLNRQVVIKENLPSQFAHRDTSSLVVNPGLGREDEDNFRWSMENFSREAEMLASLHHPGIVSVLRRFEAFGTAYFVMPFVEGVALDELINERKAGNKPFTEEELRGLLERTLSALDHLHDRGIYHRDIKPGNILITNDGIPVLIDFGSARQRLGERSMTVIESPGYTPFEQLQSRGNVGPWSDLYALAGTLVKAITGEAPPKATDRAFDDPFVPLADRAELRAAYSSSFLRCLDRALGMKPADRWQDAGEWLKALREPTVAQQQPVRQEPKVVGHPAVSWKPETLARNPELKPSSSAPTTAQAAESERKSNPVPWIVAACLVLGLFAIAKTNSKNKDESRPFTTADDSALQQEQERESKIAEKQRLEEQSKKDQADHATKEMPFKNSLGMKLVPIANYEGGKRVHFCIWETRRKDYDSYGKSKPGVNREWAVPGINQQEDHPVVKVSWDDANAFCQWLTSVERESGLIGPRDEYRLPTDAEWSIAVGLEDFKDAGTPKAKDEKITDHFPWGRAFPPPSRSGNFADQSAITYFNSKFKVIDGYSDGFVNTSPVGSFPANGRGLHDLSGNVWEWCSDSYSTDPNQKVARGGSWGSYSRQFLLSSCRSALPHYHRSTFHGFRCVLVVNPR